MRSGVAIVWKTTPLPECRRVGNERRWRRRRNRKSSSVTGMAPPW